MPDDFEERLKHDEVLAEQLKAAIEGSWRLGHSYFPCPFCHHGTLHLYRNRKRAILRSLQTFCLHRAHAVVGHCDGCGWSWSASHLLHHNWKQLGTIAFNLFWIVLVIGGLFSFGSLRNALLAIGASLLVGIALYIRDDALYDTTQRKLSGWKMEVVGVVFFLILFVAYHDIWPR